MKPNVRNFRIRFLGAAGTVTGSRYLLTNDQTTILVDCGLFQGLKELRLKNWDRFPIDPAKIDAVILTHAHIDHSGYIPRLIKEGFKGKIYCTLATKALCQILLPDTGYLQQEEAEWINKKHFSKHENALPLFDQKDAEQALKLFAVRELSSRFEVVNGIYATFNYIGHILGAASVVVELDKTKIAFTGDVGRPDDLLLYPPQVIPQVDYLVTESTYGDRRHENHDSILELEKIINESLKNRGAILIPAFTVGRAQLIMHQISILKKQKRIPSIPMYLNSPMAQEVTRLYREFKSLHRLSDQDCLDMEKDFQYIKTVDESKKLNERKDSMIIISASGMATGGRILHHLKAFISKPTTTVILAGFQAQGTRGRHLQDGIQEIKIHGEFFKVNARIRVLENSSAHADYFEIGNWLRQANLKPKQVFITHGEVGAAEAMKTYLSKTLAWSCLVPKQDQEFLLP